MIRFERVERIGEGRENFSEEKFSLPSPNPTSPFPKTFDFIESLFGERGIRGSFSSFLVVKKRSVLGLFLESALFLKCFS